VPWASEPAETNTLELSALLASLAGLVILALPLGAIALCLSGWSLISLDTGARAKRLALAGLALGAVDVGAWLVHMAVRVNAAAGA
jgi:hypothetical protein